MPKAEQLTRPTIHHHDARWQSKFPSAGSALHGGWNSHLARAQTDEASSSTADLHTHEPVGRVGQKQEDEIRSLCQLRLRGGVGNPPCERFLEIHVV